MNENLIRKAEEAHHEMMIGMYFSGYKDTNLGRFLWSETLNSSWWNYLTFINIKEKEINSLLDQTKKFYQLKKRTPALYISLITKPDNLKNILLKKEFKSDYIDSWMFYSGKKHEENLNNSIKIIEVKNKKDMEIFIEIFIKAFSDEKDVYGKLPPEYGNAIMNSSLNPKEKITTTHYIAFIGEEPIGVATVVHYNDFAGIYNIGVLPKGRKQGIGSALTMKCVREAIEKNIEEIFLQTEKNSYNEKYYSKLGFSEKFTGECFILD